MKLEITEMEENKKDILARIKNPYQIKPMATIIVLIVAVFMLITIIGTFNGGIRELRTDVIGASINLLLAWNLGVLLYMGIWQFLNSRKINKVLFPELEQFINESDTKSFAEVEIEAHNMIKVAYTDYKVNYNKLKRFCWTSLIISFVITMITLLIEAVYLLF